MSIHKEFRKFMDDGQTPRCQERVWSGGRSMISYQCSRKGLHDDGAHCRVHSAGAVAERQKKSRAAYDKGLASKRRLWGSPYIAALRKMAAADSIDVARDIARRALSDN